MGIEPMTPSLPRKSSTTELLRHASLGNLTCEYRIWQKENSLSTGFYGAGGENRTRS